MKRKIQSLASRLTGFSTPFIGASWIPPADEGQQARNLVALLEDHRVLYSPYEAEVPEHCISSVDRLRRETTELLANAKRDSVIGQSLLRIRAACRKFMDSMTDEVDRYGFERGHRASFVLLPSLGELRSEVGIQLARLGAAYDLEIEEDLHSIVPPQIEGSSHA